jgi:hypothetical protein
MRLFGILLIPVILLAGAGYVYLATQDWKGRQTITAAGVRHLLLLQGLPLEAPPGGEEFTADDETPFHMEMGGDARTRTISKALLTKYFADNTAGAAAPADGGEPKVALTASTPVTNQVSEVKRVYALIKAELGKELPPAQKIALLKGWLLLQAETIDERIDYQVWTSPEGADGKPKTDEQLAADAKKLEDRLYAKFDAVINPPRLTDGPGRGGEGSDKEKLEKSAAWRSGATLDETDRRMRLAHLLVHLDRDAGWQKRVIVVVGLRRYVKAVAVQAERFRDMAARIDKYLPGDQSVFVEAESKLRADAIRNTERVKAVAEIKAARIEQKTRDDDAVSRRRTQLKELTDQLNKVKAEVDELLVRQTGIEKQLFEIQREVALTLDEVYRLEALLTATERERYGKTPPPGP